MRSSLRTILLLSIATLVWQSCDSSLNVDKPKDYYKYIGRDGDQTGIDLVTDAGGNAYILGSSRTAADGLLGQQVYVVMTNPSGEMVWSKILGGDGDDVPKDIEMLADGSLIVVADRSDGDFTIYQLDKDTGAETKPAVVSGLEIVKQLGKDTVTNDHATSITQTADGFIVAGYTDNGSYKTALIARYDQDLASYPISWDYQMRFFEDTDGYDVVPIKVIQKDPKTFILFGYTNKPGLDGISNYNFFIQGTGETNTPSNGMFFIDVDPAKHSDDILTSVKAVPLQAGAGYILTGYTTDPNSGRRGIYVARVVEDLQSVKPDAFLGKTKTIPANPSNLFGGLVSVGPSATDGFYVLASQGLVGDNNLYLTKLGNDLNNAWGDDDPARSLGGVGDDFGGVVAETVDGRVLVVGTMVLGDLKGQRKIVLMNLNSDGMFGN